jgi:chitinase
VDQLGGVKRLLICLLLGLLATGTAMSGANFQTSSKNPQTGVSAAADWAPPQGVAVQTANRSGGTSGRPENGDTITFTYSESMNPASLLVGWDGGPTYVSLTIVDSNGIETLSMSGVALGSVAFAGNYVSSNRSVQFYASSMDLSATSVTVTLGVPLQSSYLRTDTAKRTLVWTPSASARDLAGRACLTTAVSGSSERQF